MYCRCFLTLLAFFSFVCTEFAQTPTEVGASTEIKQAANDAYQKQDWQAAAVNYEKIVKLENKNVSAHYRYGIALLNLNKNSEALVPLEKAFASSPNPIFALALARSFARLGEKEKAYEILEKSLTLGGIAPESLTAEKDFAPLKSEARFVDLVKRSDLAVNPCKARPEFRQFDFWIGEWLPKNPQGVTVGTSSVQLILGSCILFENWETPVSAGKSFNVYDVRDGKWHQTWVDAKGNMTHYVGGLVDGRMVLESESIASGRKAIARMTFSKLANGDVRQHGENSTDEGKTWTTTFDFTYVRKK
jgi:hypothetical protein